jgi:ATP-dependent NAD(P)H-hydrate dehydratase
MAALRTGADLVWVACAAAAATPLKSLSPELIVLPALPSEEACGAAAGADGGGVEGEFGALAARYFPPGAARAAASAALKLRGTLARIDALVIGPGLGRSEGAFATAAELIGWARRASVPCVLDGDALSLAAAHVELVHAHPTAILTPNVAEFARLAESAARRRGGGAEAGAGATPARTAAELAAALGGTAVLQKAEIDAFACGGVAWKGRT